MNTLVHLFPFAQETKTSIEQQNKFLRKVSLTGKINALSDTENLFAYTDRTIEKFEHLKEALITALVKENIKKYEGELGLSASLGIDVLKRNLFERTADVGFLSQDSEIIRFLEGDMPCEEIMLRLQEYVMKYSVYDDVVLLDCDGNIKARIKQDESISQTKDTLLQEALSADGYVEKFAFIDMFSLKTKSLIYAQKVLSRGKVVGVLVLSFRFEDELSGIFSSLARDGQVLALEDSSGVIATSDGNFARLGDKLSVSSQKSVQLYKQKFIAFCAKTTGYQGYFGLDWKMRAIAQPMKVDSGCKAMQEGFKKQVLASDLMAIITEAHEVVDDLGDVIINGELIASKNRVYTLTPILDSLRDISASFLQDLTKASETLANLHTQTMISMLKISTKFSMDLMDRNLYERANDCRWWALTPAFAEELKKEELDGARLQTILSTINDLYTVYTNIFIYDKQGKIVASSRDQSLLNQQVDARYMSNVLRNRDAQKYFVSEFEQSPFYEDKATYIYNASICHEDNVLGGIGVVFDSEPEFKAILMDSAIKDKKGFSLFCDASKRVISSTHNDIKVLDKIDLPDTYFDKSHKEPRYEFITYHDKSYVLCVAPSLGYREYKKTDGYENDIFALSFIEA